MSTNAYLIVFHSRSYAFEPRAKALAANLKWRISLTVLPQRARQIDRVPDEQRQIVPDTNLRGSGKCAPAGADAGGPQQVGSRQARQHQPQRVVGQVFDPHRAAVDFRAIEASAASSAVASGTQSAGRRSARLWSRMQTGSSAVKVSGRRWYHASLPLLTAQSQRLHSIICVYAATRIGVACIGVAHASICNRLQEARMSTNITSSFDGFNTRIACG